MDRRSFIKLITAGIIGHELDLDRLLWVPGEKTIFLPPVNPTITLNEIVAMEIQRMLPKIRATFMRDDMFYKALVGEMKFTTEIRVPIEYKKV